MSFYSRLYESMEYDSLPEYDKIQAACRLSDQDLIRLLRKRGYVIRKSKASQKRQKK
jgi:hypothetical protein